MLRCTRTTIRLDPALLSEAKAHAARSGRTLTNLIEEALREALSRGASTLDTAPYRVEAFCGTGLAPGVDLDDSAALLDLMEGK